MTTLRFECRHRFASGFSLDVAFQTDRLVTSLFGPSGCGKTSTLSVLSGLLQPREACIHLGEECLADTSRGVWLPPERRHVGCVFQDHLLFPHLNVEGNLSFGQKHSSSRQARVERGRVAEVLELTSLLSRKPSELSGGQRQRVALGRALLSQPKFLLMDEPLAALDETIKTRILNYLERIVHEFQIPTLFVSHSQSEVRRFSQWVVVVEAGSVVAQGEPGATLDQPKTLGWKRAEGPINLLRVECYRASDGQLYGRLGAQALKLPTTDGLETSDGDSLYVQFSPDQVMIARGDITGLSTRNHLHGVVRQLVAVIDGVYVAIDVGQVLWAHLTNEAIRDLQLASGDEVVALVKTHALEIV